MQPETLPHGDNRVDLDPHHRDRWACRCRASPSIFTRTNSACKNSWRESERKSCARPARAKSGLKKKADPIAGRAGQEWAPIQKTRWSTNFARAMMCPISSSSDPRFFPRWPGIRRPRRLRRSPIERRNIFSPKSIGSTELLKRVCPTRTNRQRLRCHSGVRRNPGGFSTDFKSGCRFSPA
jgi:hypothetical protein